MSSIRKFCQTSFSLIVLICFAAVGQAHEVVTFAGTGTSGRAGDNGPAAQAQVGGPFGISLGPDNALYVCETTTHVIRRIAPDGRVTTVAGIGKAGYSGDGGPATRAELNEPYEVRFDRAGHMFFVEMQNHIVRRVDRATGIISTVAGTGEAGFSGDNGPAIHAKFQRPHSIALDSTGSLYICDIGNHRIRRVDLQTGIVSTFAGTGARQKTPDGAQIDGTPLNGPRALDFDGKHSLYLALREGNQVFRVDLKSRTLHHIGGTGLPEIRP